MVSGALAGRCFVGGDLREYDHCWQERLGRLLRASMVNRYLFEKLGILTVWPSVSTEVP